MKELVSIISNEWLEESELSSDVIRLDSPSISIHCQINKDPFDALYNPVVDVNIMFASFASLISCFPSHPYYLLKFYASFALLYYENYYF